MRLVTVAKVGVDKRRKQPSSVAISTMLCSFSKDASFS
jgi:hypothetical protein